MHAKHPVGLARTDNNMEFTTWPQVNMINQKNYYTYVRPFTSLFVLACYIPERVYLPSEVTMVGRKVLDGLRKGKKDIYALNIQYVRR